jgi:2-polyprenyl-6-methoxyphenol hydroxylase-like FAD-dependent oxidoreductase
MTASSGAASRQAVISGAGIAGTALAHQLARGGWRATVVERFFQRRDEGQNVDVRGAAREVARGMRIEEDLRAANTGEVGMRFVRGNGSPAASFPISAPGEIDGPTAEFEILRGELSRILVEHTSRSTDYRFGTQIADLTECEATSPLRFRMARPSTPTSSSSPRGCARDRAGSSRPTTSAVGQVRAPVWSRGRTVLLGDAAFCPATFGGSGTSMALFGGYVLAGELSRTTDHRAALTAYEDVMRPHVEASPRMSVLRQPIVEPAPVSARCTPAPDSPQVAQHEPP